MGAEGIEGAAGKEEQGSTRDEGAALKARIAELEAKVKVEEAAKATLAREKEEVEREVMSEEYLAYLEARKKEGAEKKAPLEGKDWDSMSGKELATELVKLQEARLAEVQQALHKAQAQLIRDSGAEFARIDLELCKARHPDLAQGLEEDAYKSSFISIARENPSWNAEKVYRTLARELREREEEKVAKEEERKRKELSSIGEKGGIPQSVTSRKDLSAEEAVDLAYRKHAVDIEG